MDESKLKPVGDISVKTGEYEKDGKTRNRYARVGTLFATPHYSRISIKLDTLPLGGDGWLTVFMKDDQDTTPSMSGIDKAREIANKLRPKEAVEVDDSFSDRDQPINLEDIPF